MGSEKLHQFMEEYSRMAKEKPEAFRSHAQKVLACALLYIVVLLVVLVGVMWWGIGSMISETAGFGTVLLTMLAVVGFWSGLRGILSRVEVFGGQRLLREDAPALFEMVDSLQEQMEVERIDAIWVDAEFNAMALQRPLFGLIGMTRCQVSLGLPLLSGLSASEVRSVLAHELAHFERGHGAWALWSCRVSAAWRNIAESALAGLFMWPFSHFLGLRFVALSSVIRRAHEFEADEREASLVGSEVFAKTLLKIYLLQTYLREDFVPAFTRETATSENPPSNFMTSALVAIREFDLVGAKAKERLRFASGQEADFEDSHPPLFARLRALWGDSTGPVVPQEDVKKALEVLGGPWDESSLDSLIADPARLIAVGDKGWQAKWRMTWKTSRQEWLFMEKRLIDLESKRSGANPLTETEAWERVTLTKNLQGEEVIKPLLEEFVAAHPSHGPGCLAYALVLYQERDQKCQKWAEKAAEADAKLKPVAIRLRQQWLRENGQFEAAASLEKLLFSERSSRGSHSFPNRD